MKKIQIIAKQQAYLDTITRQLEVIFGDMCQLSSGTLQEVTREMLANKDAIVISKEMLIGIIRSFIPENCPIIIAQREVNILGTKEIFNLPKSQRILVISDTADHVEETVQSLRNIYFEHEYIPYHPERKIPDNVDWIITPGEEELVPRGFSNVINIGPRGICFKSVLEIAHLIDVDYDQIMLMNRFLKSHLALTINHWDMYSTGNVLEEQANHSPKTSIKVKESLLTETSFKEGIAKIEAHGFLEESIEILEVYYEAKKELKSIGRKKVRELLIGRGVQLSDQQLRLRLEVMQTMDLLIARQGRGGTKISEKGELFLKKYYKEWKSARDIKEDL